MAFATISLNSTLYTILISYKYCLQFKTNLKEDSEKKLALLLTHCASTYHFDWNVQLIPYSSKSSVPVCEKKLEHEMSSYHTSHAGWS